MQLRSDERVFGVFLWLWVIVSLAKVGLAAHLPLFVDEAFYWQEGQHLAWAYSDLPGATAWLTALGVWLGGQHALALRLPFLVMAAAIPWLMASITARECGRRAGWIAAIAALALPLAGTLGLLALPDVILVLATVLCMDAIGRLLRRIGIAAALELAVGLMIGASSHYRFLAIVVVGALVLLACDEGRRLLRDWRILGAILVGQAGWIPLLAWNIRHAEAGLRFQLLDRHPWAFHADGIVFIVIQALLVTPLLFLALARAAAGWRSAATPGLRMFGLMGGMIVLGFFLLGFFADTERVSFHWPLSGYVALLPLLPLVSAHWSPGRCRATASTTLFGLSLALLVALATSIPAWRARMASGIWYPDNFSGWRELADAVSEQRERMPPDTVLVADNFKIGAELGFALGNPRIVVLDHPLNHKHGRAPQLALWNLTGDAAVPDADRPVLLVIAATDVRYRDLLRRYHWLCARFGSLPPPRVVNVDHGRRRYLLLALAPGRIPSTQCATPALAWIDLPRPGQSVSGGFQVRGWAFKDGIGLHTVEVLLDGEPVAQAEYGLPMPQVAAYWRISTDPVQPRVGFRAWIDMAEVAPGRHWLGLRLHGRDGSREDWGEQPIELH